MGARLDDCTGSGIAGHLILQLQGALSEGTNAGDSEAAEAIRDLVETVTVFRDPSRPGGVTVEIAGRLNALRAEQAYPQTRFTALLSEAGAAWGRYRLRGGSDAELAGRGEEHRPAYSGERQIK